jgi:uncharacterized membrane protein YeiH
VLHVVVSVGGGSLRDRKIGTLLLLLLWLLLWWWLLLLMMMTTCWVGRLVDVLYQLFAVGEGPTYTHTVGFGMIGV